MQNKAVNWTLV